MKRILINATHNEEIRVALCKDNHLYDFDLENRTREQKKANIYKGHITRVEPSLEAAFVEYGSSRQGFLPLREIAPEYLKGNIREDNIKQLIREGDEVIVQVEKEERGNKGAALSTYISLAGRYLVLMPNNAKGGGISRQISGKVRDEMKQIIANLSVPEGMSVIVRTAGIGKGFDDIQNDLNHLLDIWQSINEQNRTRPSPCLVHQEAGVVTRAVRDYLRDDISEVWIDSENAYNEAASFIAAVMPSQMGKLRKYTDYEPMFAAFGIERQIESAYQREVRLPSGGSIVIDQTEAMVAIDINSSKSTKGSDVAETAYHTNLEAADEIARQLRLRDMGGLIVIDFIDMNETRHQKDVEKRLIEATRYDRARVQFAEISKFGLMEMSRQRLRPSLEEATGYLCPRCHGNGMIRDLRSLALSIMRQIEQIALKERSGEIQAEVPTEIAAFLLNEKRESLVYLEQDSGARVTILPHAHLESPNFSLHFNPDGFAPSSYERIVDVEAQLNIERGYDTNWHTEEKPNTSKTSSNHWQDNTKADQKSSSDRANNQNPQGNKVEPQAVAWLSNLFAPKPSATVAGTMNNADAAAAIESIVNSGGVSLGAMGSIQLPTDIDKRNKNERTTKTDRDDKYKNKKTKPAKDESLDKEKTGQERAEKRKKDSEYQKREAGSVREPRYEVERQPTLSADSLKTDQKNRGEQNTRPKTERAEKDGKKERGDKKPSAPARPKHSTPDEVVLHVGANGEKPEPITTTHLSLDGSKPIAVHEVDAPKTAVPAIHQESDNTKNDQTKFVQKANTEQEEAAAENNTQEDLTHVEANQGVVDSLEDNQITQSQALAQSQSIAQDEIVTHKFDLNIKHEQLLSKAALMNKVVNDPRVVKAVLDEQNISTSSTRLTGNAGDFIKQTLGDAATGKFVDDFINALEKQYNNAPSATVFDFANFGYQALSDNYIAEFNTATNPESTYGISQGKTEVTLPPIGERASNDPRGQHPDYVASTVVTADDVAMDITSQDLSGSTDVESDQSLPNTSEAVDDNVEINVHSDAVVQTSDVQEAQEVQAATPAESEVEPKDESNTQQESIVTSLLDDAENMVEKVVHTTESAIESLVQTLEEVIKPDAPASNATKGKSKKEKTTVTSYKDMIENVSGQLLPPTGILNLVAPKKPKTTKAKTPKAPAKKTSKAAQKAEVVKRKPKENQNSETAETTNTDDAQ